MTAREMEAAVFAVESALMRVPHLSLDAPEHLGRARRDLWRIAAADVAPEDPAVSLIPLDAFDELRHTENAPLAESASGQFEMLAWALDTLEPLTEAAERSGWADVALELWAATVEIATRASEIEAEWADEARHLARQEGAG